MSAGVEGSKRLDVRPRPRDGTTEYALREHADDTQPPPRPDGDAPKDAPVADADPQPAAETAKPHDHPLLIDAHEDRWGWRRKIRQNPRQLFFYRICVALLGLLLLCLAALTGPLPGPGGIPIAILGIAVWSSEFEWAQRLMIWFKAQLKRYQALPRSRRLLFWAVIAVLAASGAYTVLLVFGIPFWVPEFLANWLRHLPGV
jgi:uncharacterized protein (TIGR02611 family)